MVEVGMAAFSTPVADSLGKAFGAAFVIRPIVFNGAGGGKSAAAAPLRSLSFNGRESKPTVVLKAFGSGKLFVEGSRSFNSSEISDPADDAAASKPFSSTANDSPPSTSTTRQVGYKPSRFINPDGAWSHDGSRHEATLKLQRVYKSFRTRRQLADCAVLAEQRWWKLLDFALLKRNSTSYFDGDKPESVSSRWSRAATMAAKVGKGLSKDEKARKLHMQHWLEIDPRHRYGHNLQFYYDRWLHCESKQPFFYWLDVGEGKEVNLEDKCPRSILQQQCIKYLGPKEREAYEVIVEDGLLLYKKSMELLDTSQGQKGAKWIFVLSTSRAFYVGEKKKGNFQHSSFLAGGAASAAGRLVVENGVLKAVWPHSGHYHPTEQNFQEFMSFLKENNVDLTKVKKCPAEGDEELDIIVARDTSLASDVSASDSMGIKTREKDESIIQETSSLQGSMSHEEDKRGASLSGPPYESKCLATRVEDCKNEDGASTLDLSETIPSNGVLEGPKLLLHVNLNLDNLGNQDGDQYMLGKQNLFMEEEGQHREGIPGWMLRRVNSAGNGRKSCLQPGRKWSGKWTTGAGARIGCVRDCPSEMLFRALEDRGESFSEEK